MDDKSLFDKMDDMMSRMDKHMDGLDSFMQAYSDKHYGQAVEADFAKMSAELQEAIKGQIGQFSSVFGTHTGRIPSGPSYEEKKASLMEKIQPYYKVKFKKVSRVSGISPMVPLFTDYCKERVFQIVVRKPKYATDLKYLMKTISCGGYRSIEIAFKNFWGMDMAKHILVSSGLREIDPVKLMDELMKDVMGQHDQPYHKIKITGSLEA